MAPPPVSETAAITAEQEARSILERLEYPDAQSLSSGDVIELANLIAEGHRLRADNERLCKWYDEQIHLAFEVRRLRAENERLTLKEKILFEEQAALDADNLSLVKQCRELRAARAPDAEVRHLETALRELEPKVKAQCDMNTQQAMTYAITAFVALRSQLAAATRERETPPDDTQPAPQR